MPLANTIRSSQHSFSELSGPNCTKFGKVGQSSVLNNGYGVDILDF